MDEYSMITFVDLQDVMDTYSSPEWTVIKYYPHNNNAAAWRLDSDSFELSSLKGIFYNKEKNVYCVYYFDKDMNNYKKFTKNFEEKFLDYNFRIDQNNQKIQFTFRLPHYVVLILDHRLKHLGLTNYEFLGEYVKDEHNTHDKEEITIVIDFIINFFDLGEFSEFIFRYNDMIVDYKSHEYEI